MAYILGIETSCDETAASVTENGRKVLSNVVYSQIPVHELYGGVVPEIASRKHIDYVIEYLYCIIPSHVAASSSTHQQLAQLFTCTSYLLD